MTMIVRKRSAQGFLLGSAVGLSFLTTMLASAGTALATDDAARAALDRAVYARTFNEIHDRLAAQEAVGAGHHVRAEPWTSAATPPPRATTREVPPMAYQATVAYPSAGSWREAGDHCIMGASGTVRVLGSTDDLGALVRYGRPGATTTSNPSACSDGTIAFVPTGMLFAWPEVGSSLTERREVGARLETAAGAILSGQGMDLARHPPVD